MGFLCVSFSFLEDTPKAKRPLPSLKQKHKSKWKDRLSGWAQACLEKRLIIKLKLLLFPTPKRLKSY